MTEVIGMMDRFIVANSSTTQSELDLDKTRQMEESRKTNSLKVAEACRRTAAPSASNPYATFLNWIDANGTDPIRRQIAQLTAHPRKPLMNPCM